MTDNAVTRHPLSVDDPQVARLARWLENAQLGNGTPCMLPPGGLADYIAQAILNWQNHLVYDHDSGHWIPVTHMSAAVHVNDVEVEHVADRIVRMTHTPTGIVALDETHQQAFDLLKRKVKEHLGA